MILDTGKHFECTFVKYNQLFTISTNECFLINLILSTPVDVSSRLIVSSQLLIVNITKL